MLELILTVIVVTILNLVFYWKTNSVESITIPMATDLENLKFRIRYKNLWENQELYRAGLRNGQYGVVLKHKSGMFAKTTVDGKCKYIRIFARNYEPTN